MQNVLSDYYRSAVTSEFISPCLDHMDGTGFFRFGKNIVCYGECSTGVATSVSASADFDASKATRFAGTQIRLPFAVSEVIENLRKEHYVGHLNVGRKKFTSHALIRDSYYFVRDLLPVWFRRHLQRAYFKGWKNLPFPQWPVDFTVELLHEALLRLAMQAHGSDKVPFIWFWPSGASACLILTHDVETAAGRDFVPALMDMDQSRGFRASFQNVPEKRYQFSESYVSEIRARGFEFNIHDLNHDGYLFEEKTRFLQHAKQINEYARKYNAQGFRSGAMYRNQDWFDAFEFSYDMSVPNVAHLEPQGGGCCTVMPYFIGKILELPLTTAQDYSIFHILNEYSIDLWKEQVDQIRRRNGLISFITHPDYLLGHRARSVYELLLDHLRGICCRHDIWEALPGEVDRWWRARSEMKLIVDGNGYRIEGPESERACIAYATLDGDSVAYSVEKHSARLS